MLIFCIRPDPLRTRTHNYATPALRCHYVYVSVIIELVIAHRPRTVSIIGIGHTSGMPLTHNHCDWMNEKIDNATGNSIGQNAKRYTHTKKCYAEPIMNVSITSV